MSTTIDSLAIEIQSNSSGAVSSIESLAAALEKIKKSTVTKTAVQNLSSLAGAIKDLNASSSGSKALGTLADALNKIAGVGSLRGLASQLKELPTALQGLANVNLEGVAPKIESIAKALAPLSSVKGGGFSSAINGLSKIGEVTQKLDDDTINAFVERVKDLDTKLGPVSKNLIAVGNAIKNVNTTAKSAGSSVDGFGKKVNASRMNTANLITVVKGLASALRPVINLIKNNIAVALEWDGVSARFGRGFGEQASEVYSWIQRLNSELKINTQQFMQYSSTFATMLSGFGVAGEDASKMALGYMELTYDIWAGYNDIYKSLDDAATAIRSAIAGEVEPIRKAGFTIIESTLEQTAANHGLKISLEKATEAQKSYLRYLTLVDQAKSQSLVGTYAREMNTAEGVMRTFRQQLTSLGQAFGSLFLPALVKVMPYIQAFVELLSDAIRNIAAFFGITIQGVDWSDYNKGSESLDDLGEAADSAKASVDSLKQATIGIDELNVISPNSGGGGGSGSNSTDWDDLDVDSLWDESVFNGIQDKVGEIKKGFEDWLPVLEAVGIALGALTVVKLLTGIGNALTQLGTLQSVLAGLAITVIEAALVFKFTDDYLEEGSLKSLLGEAITVALGSWMLYKTFGDKGLVIGIGVAIAAQLASITLNLADGGVEMSDPELWIQSAFTTVLGGVAGGWMAYKGLIPMSTGKGVCVGLLLTASLTLAAITIGEITANGEVTKESLLTGVGSVLTAAGFGFAVGGVWGLVIGAAASLAINIGGAIIGVVSKNAEQQLKEDLDNRFGKLEMSVSEAHAVIEKLVPEWVEGVDYAAQLWGDVESMLESIKARENTLGGLEWQVSVGITLTEAEGASYKSAIDGFVDDCQKYVTDRGYALEIGLKATTSNDRIIESANSVSTLAKQELENLGKKLQETVNAAYEDGLLDIDELEAIQTIRNDMREIVNALTGSDISAEFDILKLRWSGVSLDADSFDTMIDEWNTTIQDTIKPALETTVKENLKALEGNIAYLKLALEKKPDNKDLQIQLRDAEIALQKYLDENPLDNLTLEVNLEAVNFGLNSLKDLFAEEIAKAEEEAIFDTEKITQYAPDESLYQSALSQVGKVGPGIKVQPTYYKLDFGEGDIYWGLNELYRRLEEGFASSAKKISGENQKNIQKIVESLKPTMDDLEEIAKNSRLAGETVIQSVRDGLNDYNEIAALGGDVDAINYEIGRKLSTDPVFLNTLATMENAGKSMPESIRKGLLNNVDYVIDEATGLVIGIKNAVTDETMAMTPELEKNFRDMGVTFGNALGGEYQYVYDETTGLLSAIVDSATDQKIWVRDEMNKVAEECSDGFNNGLELKKPSLLEKIDSWCGDVLKRTRASFEIKSPSKKMEEIGMYLTEGLKNGMEANSLRDKLSNIWTAAKTWWDKSRGSLSTYTPNIGDIKGKLSSAWNTAKKWWGDNVRLSIPSLGFKVTYTTKGLGTVQKAIVKALGLDGWPKLSFAANGGIFDAGSLIWAGERGAEIVANAGGGKTGVMNVQQMSEAVYEGVYSAVVAAMRASGGNGGAQSVNVYLDGKQVTGVVEQHQKERGASLMGRQVYSY